MTENDTILLLRECDSGAKMAITAIEEILEKTQDKELKKILDDSRTAHQQLCSDAEEMLFSHGSAEKEPNPMAVSMSWFKTNIKLGINDSDKTIADLITDGCNMGIKTLFQYLGKYKAADNASVSLCKKLIDEEENLRHDLCCYL